VGIGPFVNEETEDHFAQAALVLVVNDQPEGFVAVELVDGIPHIWQLSVDPEHGRQGLGGALVEAACDWARSEGFDAITLTTYRDVPWNGPFFESFGFSVIGTLTPELTEIRKHEREIGDDDFAARVAMRLELFGDVRYGPRGIPITDGHEAEAEAAQLRKHPSRLGLFILRALGFRGKIARPGQEDHAGSCHRDPLHHDDSAADE
jgi:hypothetical protein